MNLTTKDKQLIKQIAEHFKISLGDAVEIFEYARYKKKTKNIWIKKILRRKSCSDLKEGI